MAYETDYTLFEQVIQMLAANKDNKFSRVIETVVNEAMKLERTQALQAEPYERTNERTGYANGFKDKTLALATGKVLLKIPQVRGLEFYPSCIEKGIRSERSLKLAIAEMYVKGVSTRRVSDIVEILCGTEVSSSQVSRLAKELDASSPAGSGMMCPPITIYESENEAKRFAKRDSPFSIALP